MPRPKILFVSGSIRSSSYNQKLVRTAFSMAQSYECDPQLINLSDFELPIYNGDLEKNSGHPEKLKELKKIFANADGFLLSSPEYNGAFSPLVKNTIDWLSRKENDQEKPMIAFDQKVCALIAASPGNFGGIRAMPALRVLLSELGTLVIPKQFGLAKANQAFNSDGSLIAESHRNGLSAVLKQFIEVNHAIKNFYLPK